MRFSFLSLRTTITVLVVAGISVIQLLAAPDQPRRVTDAAKPARMNCGARIECITPDGLPGRLALARQDSNAAVLIMEDDSISCPLREGETTFVIALPRSCGLERLKFINENAAARGTLRLAVANEELPANSPRWIMVDGSIGFQNKRLFNVSMVGVEAKFVRVSFKVEGEGVGLSLAMGEREMTRQNIFGDDLAKISAMPLIAAVEP